MVGLRCCYSEFVSGRFGGGLGLVGGALPLGLVAWCL